VTVKARAKARAKAARAKARAKVRTGQGVGESTSRWDRVGVKIDLGSTKWDEPQRGKSIKKPSSGNGLYHPF
jgi:hypothetical protein